MQVGNLPSAVMKGDIQFWVYGEVLFLKILPTKVIHHKPGEFPLYNNMTPSGFLTGKIFTLSSLAQSLLSSDSILIKINKTWHAFVNATSLRRKNHFSGVYTIKA